MLAGRCGTRRRILRLRARKHSFPAIGIFKSSSEPEDSMAFDRRTAAQYLLPIGSMALAMALRLGAKPAEHAALPVHILLGTLVIVLVFATVFAVAASRGEGGASARRTLWHAGSDSRGHSNRGVGHRLDDAARREQSGPGARIRVLDGDDRVRRYRGNLPDRRRLAASLPGYQTARHQRVPGRADRADRADPDPSQFYDCHRPRHILDHCNWGS